MSDDALELVFDTLWGKLVEEETVCVSVKGVGFRWAKFPRRCISRETSFESYVRPIELYQKVRVSVSVESIRSKHGIGRIISVSPRIVQLAMGESAAGSRPQHHKT